MNLNTQNHKFQGEAGFSLLEIMVAVAILAVSFLSLINFQGQTLSAAGRAEKLTIATFLAQEKMGEVVIKLEKEIAGGLFPDEKSEEGGFDEPYEDFKWSWRLRKVELPLPEASGGGGSPMELMFGAVAKEIAKVVREVKLTITWEDLGKEQTAELITHFTKL